MPNKKSYKPVKTSPPDDPPILPSDDLAGIEITAGFAPSMIETDPDEEELPAWVNNNDLDLAEDIYLALRNTSETSDLVDEIQINVTGGVVIVGGIVPTDADIALVDEILSDMDGVVNVRNLLEVAD